MQIKISLLFLFSLGLFPKAGLTQDTLKKRNYQVWLRSTQSREVFSGYLQSLSDSTVTLTTNRKQANTDLQVIPVEQVQWVKFRKRKNIRRGIGLGALCGFVLGGIYGVSQGSDPPCQKNEWICLNYSAQQKGLLLGLLYTPLGAIIGGTYGSLKTKITIGGNQDKYKRQRKALEKYRLRQ